MFKKKETEELRKVVEILTKQNKELKERNKLLMKMNAELYSVCAYVSQNDDKGFNRINNFIKEGNMYKEQMRESIAMAMEAKEKYEELYRTLSKVSENK